MTVKRIVTLSSAIQELNKVFEEMSIDKLHLAEVQEYAWEEYYLNLIKLLIHLYT